MRVSGIIAVILNQVSGNDPDPNRLQKLGYQKRRNHHIAGAYPTIGKAKQAGGSASELLRLLNGAFFAM